MNKWIVVFLSGLTLAIAQPSPDAARKEVLAASDALNQAIMKKDAAALQKLLHDDLTYAHSAGLQQTKAEVIQAAMGSTTTEAIDFSDTTVRVYGNTALVKAHVELRNNNGGKATTNHLNILFVWIKGPGGWQLVARQASQQPLPAAQ
jgi:ketosteroid isomerase-like protein